MSDIVERLRNWERVDIVDAHEDGALYNAAADEIERLRDAINRVADLSEKWEDNLVRQINDISRAVLKGE